jgi:hypothetical protein
VKVSARRFGASLLGLTGVVTVCIGCSSLGNGTPVPGTAPASSSATSSTGATVSSTSAQSSASAPVSVPSSGTGSAAPGGGRGTATKFCADFTSGALNLQPTNGLDGPVKVWQKLAADAPPEIKSDAETIRDFLKGLASGSTVPSQTAGVSTALQHLTTWAVSHCAGD